MSAEGPAKPAKKAAPKKGKDDDMAIKKEELTEEDRLLKERLEDAVEKMVAVGSTDVEIGESIDVIAKEIREATSSMSSVPKPLKFLNAHYDKIKGFEAAIPEDGKFKKAMCDVMAVLAMTMGDKDKRETLAYHMAGKREDVATWGHEFVRALSGQVGDEWTERSTDEPPRAKDDLNPLVAEVVHFFMAHNAEPEAIDLLMETGKLTALINGFEHEDADMGDATGAPAEMIDAGNFQRVCLYLLRCGDYSSDPQELAELLEVALALYRRQGSLPDALRVALRMGDFDIAKEMLLSADDVLVRKQMAFILGRHRTVLEIDDEVDDKDELDDAMGNKLLSEQFLELVRELDVAEPKTPEDIYKTHLADTGSTARGGGGDVPDSAKANLASTYVNAFVNAAYGNDKLILDSGSKWVYKNKDHGIMAAAASSGMIVQWAIDEMSNKIDKFSDADEEMVRAGARLAIGLCCTGVQDLEADLCYALLEEVLEEGASSSHDEKSGAIMGLGYAYAGTAREDVLSLLEQYVTDSSFELASLSSYAIGMVNVGTADEAMISTIAQRVMESTDTELDQALARHMCLGLALHFVGKTEQADAMLMVLETMEHPIGKFATVLIRGCAYAGTGNVLQVQKMLHLCAEHPSSGEGGSETKATEGDASGGETKSEDQGPGAKYMHQSAAVLCLGLVSMGEDLGQEMTRRMTEHLLQYGDPAVRRAVPLAIAIQNLSDPHEYSVVDTLSKLSHDHHSDTAQAAIFALGLVGAGTNHSRIAGLLRQLTVFYKDEPQHLFMARISQGLLHMGKGLLTINPYHSDRFLLSPVALGGVLGAVLCGLDLKNTVHSKFHTLLFSLATAMNPRWLFLVEGEDPSKPLSTDVRVGNAMDTAGQPGRAKTISGFQTHAAPVLMGAEQRAELTDTDTTEALSSVLEGIVIIRKKEADKEAS